MVYDNTCPEPGHELCSHTGPKPGRRGEPAMSGETQAYGGGVDTHSRFISVCILYVGEPSRKELRAFPTTMEGLWEADRWIVERLGPLLSGGV